MLNRILLLGLLFSSFLSFSSKGKDSFEQWQEAAIRHGRGGNPDSAFHYIKLGLSLATAKGNDTMRYEFHFLEGMTYISLGDYKKASAVFKQAELFAVKGKSNDGALRSRIKWVESLFRAGYVDSVAALIQQSDNEIRKSANCKRKSSWYNFVASYWLDLKQYGKAIEGYQKAFHASGQCADSLNQGIILMNLGALFQNIEQNTQALKYFLQAWTFWSKAEAPPQQTLLAYNIAVSYYDLGEDSAARIWNGRALNLSLENEQWEYQFSALVLDGDIAKRKKAFVQARSAYKRAKNLLSELADAPRMEVQLRISLAELEYSSRNFQAAIIESKRLWDLAKITHDPESAKEASEYLSASFKAINEFEKALFWREQAQVLSDSVSKLENDRIFAESAEKFGAELKENKIKLLEKEKTIQKIENQRQRVNLISSFLLLILLGIFLIFFIKTNKKEKKLNASLLNLNSQLREANKVKLKLLGVVGHDLKAPLHRLMQLLRFQEEGKLYDEIQLHRFNQKIKSQLSGLTLVVDNLIDWSLLNSEQLKVKKEAVDLHVLLYEAFELYEHIAVQSEIKVRNEVKSGTLVMVDAGLSSVIIRNLVANAFKHGQNKGELIIRFEGSSSPENPWSLSFCQPGSMLSETAQAVITHQTMGERLGLGLIAEFSKIQGLVLRYSHDKGINRFDWSFDGQS